MFFAAVNHNYDHKQCTLKRRNTQNGLKSTNHKSQTMTFWTHQSCFLIGPLRWLMAVKNAMSKIVVKNAELNGTLLKELVVRDRYPMGRIAELWKMLTTHHSDEVQDIWSDICAAFTSQYGFCWFMLWKLGWAPAVTTKFMRFNTLTPKND